MGTAVIEKNPWSDHPHGKLDGQTFETGCAYSKKVVLQAADSLHDKATELRQIRELFRI